MVVWCWRVIGCAFRCAFITQLFVCRDAFQTLKSVKSIDLSWNQIRDIRAFTFSETRDLEVLDLSWNPLRSLEHGSFHGLSNLHILQMASIISDASSQLHPSVFRVGKVCVCVCARARTVARVCT